MAQSKSNKSLCLSDLSKARDALYDVRSKWENIGIELLLSKNDTDAIKRQHPSLNPLDCLTEMLSIYLKRKILEPSWDKIIAALKVRAIDESGLAYDLEQKYGSSRTVLSTTEVIESLPRQPAVEQVLRGDMSTEIIPTQQMIEQVVGDASRETQEDIAAFPYLDVTNLSKEDRRDLIQKLSRDYTNILIKFAKLEECSRKSLIIRNIPAETVANCVLNLATYKHNDVPMPLPKSEVDSFGEAMSIDKIFFLLKKHNLISYFNYGILKHVIEDNGTDNDKCMLMEYEDEFKVFCQRSVFEAPPVISKCTSPTRKSFQALITTDMRTTLADVVAAERKIADILGLNHSVLTLHEITPGSLILTLSVPASIVDDLFPLKESKLIELKTNGITILFKDGKNVKKGEVLLYW